MNTYAKEKAAARNLAFAKRKSAHTAKASARGAANLLAFLKDKRGHPISGYMPIKTEIDPLPVMAELANYGLIGVPVILGKALPLEFRRWDTEMQMVKGPFGAMIPANSELVVPDVLIVPLAAFDDRGHRLGYGGGFYDRTLKLLRAKQKILAVGFAYEAQHTAPLPTEPTDQPLDVIVTDAGVHRFPG